MKGEKIILTHIHNPNYEGCRQFLKSAERLGLKVHNACTGRKDVHHNYGDTLRDLYEALKHLQHDYEYAVYSDGGDTFIQRDFTPKPNVILFSTEKNCYPDGALAKEYTDSSSAWPFLNAGNWSAPIDAMIAFIETYNLDRLPKDANCQLEIAQAFIHAKSIKLSVQLDTNCEYFQSLWGAHIGDFNITGNQLYNLKTRSHPAIIHGNGGSDIQSIYNLYK
jgi:hypothetical protein